MEPAAGKAGLCILNRERADFIRPLATFVAGTGLWRMKELKILPDLVFNISGTSIAFIVVKTEELHDPDTVQRLRSMGKAFHKSFTIALTSTGGASAVCLHLSKVSATEALEMAGKPPIIFLTSMSLACAKVVALVQLLAENRLQGTQELYQEEKIKLVTSGNVIHSAVSSIPGVSSRTASKMLQTVGSLKDIATGSATRIVLASGIKAEDAEKIHDFFLNMS